MARNNSTNMAILGVVLLFVAVVLFASPATTQGWLDSLQGAIDRKAGANKFDVRKPSMKLLDWFGSFYSKFNDKFGRRAPRRDSQIQTGIGAGGGDNGDVNAGRFYPLSLDYLGRDIAGTGNSVAELLALGWAPEEIAAMQENG